MKGYWERGKAERKDIEKNKSRGRKEINKKRRSWVKKREWKDIEKDTRSERKDIEKKGKKE